MIGNLAFAPFGTSVFSPTPTLAKQQVIKNPAEAGSCHLGCERELGSQDFREVASDGTVVSAVKLHDVFLDTGLGDYAPELHGSFARK